MPKENTPLENKVVSKKKLSPVQIVIGCLILFVVLSIVCAGIAFFTGKIRLPHTDPLREGTNLEEKAKSDRVTGDAGELYPYGEIKEDMIVSAFVESDEGGVITVDLSNNIKAYLVVPSGSADSEGSIYTLTPYYSMPTSSSAPALPTDLGYGVDIVVETSTYNTIEPLYLVFDLDQGKTVEEISNDGKLNYFCLPTLSTFNPAGCALLKGIPTKDHTNMKYGVVSPIRDIEHNNLMFMNTTIPIGYDNLIVTQITNQATFIPIVLTKDVLTDVIRADKPGFTMPLTEALVHAVNNDIFYDDPEVYYDLNKAVYYVDNPYDSFKVIHILPKYREYLDKLKTEAPKYATKDILAKTAGNYVDLQIGDYETLEPQVKEDLIEDLIESGSHGSSNATETLTYVLHARRLEEENFENAKETRLEMLDIILADIDYYIHPEEPNGVNDFVMYESAIWASPEYFDSTKISSINEFPNLVRTSFASSSDDETAEALKKIIESLEETIKNPCNYSTPQLSRAIEIAGLINRPDLVEKLRKEIELKLIRILREGLGTLEEYALAQTIGMDDSYNCLQSLYRDQHLEYWLNQQCSEMKPLTLKTFAWKSFECETRIKEIKKPVEIPPSCNLPNPPKCQ